MVPVDGRGVCGDVVLEGEQLLQIVGGVMVWASAVVENAEPCTTFLCKG